MADGSSKNGGRKSLHEFVVLDTETTGLSVTRAGIVEVAALHFRDGRLVGRLVEFVKADVPIESDALDIHGITEAMLKKNGKEPKEVFEALIDFVADLPLVTHNGLGFDYPLLLNHFSKYKVSVGRNRLLDTLPLVAKHLKIPRGSRRLSDLARLLKIDPGRAHRAEADSLTAAKVLEHVLQVESDAEALWTACGSRTLETLSQMPAGFEVIGDAMEKGLEVSIRYQSDGKEPGDRWILPEVLVLDRGGNFAVLAYCPKDKKQKQFRLDRILMIHGDMRRSSRAA